MSYGRGPESAYLVAWPDHDVMKAGYSSCRRWRYFEIRGASILGVWQFPSVKQALDAEIILDRCLKAYGRPAFTTAADAMLVIGGQGAGYLECIRVPRFMHDGAAEQCAVAMLTSNAQGACVLGSLALSTYERTDGLTKNLVTAEINSLSVPRTHVPRFFDLLAGAA
jgi:hypothetical protein